MRWAVFVFLCVLAGSSVGMASDDSGELYRAIAKLIERYYELERRIERLEKRIEVLEKASSEDSIKGKFQVAKNTSVRACPSLRCKAISKLEKGEVVFLVKERGGWFLVETDYGVRGWVARKYLQAYSF